MIWVGSAALLLGAGLSVLAAIGVLTFPSPIARMHAATKSASLGLAFITLGAGFVDGSIGMIGIGVLVSIFLFLTAPISGHMVGRAAYRSGDQPALVRDDLAGVELEPSSSIVSNERRFSLPRWSASALTWLLLWRDPTVANLVGGAVVATLIEWLRSSTAPSAPLRLGPALRLIGFYLVQLVKSNARVAWEVITPDDSTISEGIVAYPLTSRSARVALLVANAVSFAPGTLTLELAGEDPIMLYVHALHYDSEEEVLEEIAELERRVRAAFGEEPATAFDGDRTA